MDFAEQLKSARQRLGLTQPEAAALLDVSPSWIDKAERVQRAPHVLMQEGALARLSAAGRAAAAEGVPRKRGTKK
jgi:transcriptional regulator with XRE-family HTH domain